MSNIPVSTAYADGKRKLELSVVIYKSLNRGYKEQLGLEISDNGQSSRFTLEEVKLIVAREESNWRP